jgi:hypothetical protein
MLRARPAADDPRAAPRALKDATRADKKEVRHMLSNGNSFAITAAGNAGSEPWIFRVLAPVSPAASR